MGLGLSIALFVGIPVAAIVAIGFVLNSLREPILSSARATGEVFTSIFTEPIRAGIEQVSTAFSDLPDINVRLPTFRLTGGGIETFGTDIVDVFNEAGSAIGNLFNGESTPSPPVISADPVLDVTPELNLLPGSLPVSLSTGTQRLSREDIVSTFPGTLALIDLRATPETEFLPFGEAGLRSAIEQGLALRVSGQLFQERPALKIILGGA